VRADPPHVDQTSHALKTILPEEVEENQDDITVLLVRLATYLQVWLKPQQALMDGLPSTSSASSPLISFRKMFVTHVGQLLATEDTVAKLTEFFETTMSIAEMDEEDSARVIQTLQALHYLGMFERFEPLLFGVVYSHIESRLQTTCASDFTTEGQLEDLGSWLTNDVGTWLVGIYSMAFHHLDEEAARARAIKALKPAMQRFEWHIASGTFKLRLGELFDIIVDYPESMPAIKDLAVCLAKTEQKSQLVRSLTRQIRKRLLHPGADTRDILTTYINLIRVLRVLDPPGVLLGKVAQPMRAYLRARKDTIRCIVQGMVEEDGDLMNELRGGPDNENDEVKELTEKADEEVEDYSDDGYKWVPAPIDAPADYNRNKTADIIQLLVSIYDTKELFVKELQILLAEKLLAIKNYAFEKELRNVEILKMRFGETALAGLEVMLKDCADSKRADTSLHTNSATSVSQAVTLPGW
jgi:anaphase-promoting complex subunit 2